MQFEKIDGTAKLTHSSNDRSQQPIADKLLTLLDQQTAGLQLLEISSGSGQHVGYFAPLFPNITFQPSEYDRALFESIGAYAEDCVSKNIKRPIHVDISRRAEEWELPQLACSYDYMYNCNTIHATPWDCTLGLFRAANKLLKPTGKLITYGPYAVDGLLAPESNVKFDEFLKARNVAYGIRDITVLRNVAQEQGIQLEQTLEMPANNKLLVWIKQQ